MLRLLTMLMLLALPAAAEAVDGLYRGEAIVTGTGPGPERDRGFAEALAQVVVKLTGDARLEADPRLAEYLGRAGMFAAGISYEDRLAGKKVRDEQGTRDRSFFMRVDFAEDAVDELLAKLGAKPWPADRPRLLVRLTITDGGGAFVLAADGDRGQGQREVLRSASRRRAMPLALPPETGDVELVGEMALDAEGYWLSNWQLGAARWQGARGTFDRVLPEAVERAARLLAGVE